MIGVFWYNMFSRIPLELTAIRDRNQLYVTTDAAPSIISTPCSW